MANDSIFFFIEINYSNYLPNTPDDFDGINECYSGCNGNISLEPYFNNESDFDLSLIHI